MSDQQWVAMHAQEAYALVREDDAALVFELSDNRADIYSTVGEAYRHWRGGYRVVCVDVRLSARIARIIARQRKRRA